MYQELLYIVLYIYYLNCIMTCSISKGFVTHHGYLGCEINYYYNYKKMKF